MQGLVQEDEAHQPAGGTLPCPSRARLPCIGQGEPGAEQGVEMPGGTKMLWMPGASRH